METKHQRESARRFESVLKRAMDTRRGEVQGRTISVWWHTCASNRLAFLSIDRKRCDRCGTVLK